MARFGRRFPVPHRLYKRQPGPQNYTGGSTDPVGITDSVSVELSREITDNVGISEVTPVDPRTRVTALHAFWADDPDWTDPGDGNPVDSWRNHSGGGNIANTGAARPTFDASNPDFNDHAVIDFVPGSSQYLTVNTTDVAQPYKAIVVFKADNAAALQNILGSGNGTQGFRITAAGGYTLAAGSSLNVGTADTDMHVARFTMNNTSSELWIDGASVGTGTVGTNGNAFLSVGAGTNGGAGAANFFDGQVAFVGIYDGATSDVDLAQLADDLLVYYSTPVVSADLWSDHTRTVGPVLLDEDGLVVRDEDGQPILTGDADPMGVTDSVAVTLSTERADSVGILDSISPVVDFVASEDDPIGITDSVSVELVREITDAVGLTDSVLAGLEASAEVTDAIGIPGTHSLTLERPDIIDPVGILDSVDRVADHFSASDDPVGITDSVLAELSREITDVVGILDSVAGELGREITDAVGILDSMASDQVRSITDAVGILDWYLFHLERPDTVDSVGILDSVSHTLTSTRSDAVGITDSVERVAVLSREITDVVGIETERIGGIPLYLAGEPVRGVAVDGATFNPVYGGGSGTLDLQVFVDQPINYVFGHPDIVLLDSEDETGGFRLWISSNGRLNFRWQQNSFLVEEQSDSSIPTDLAFDDEGGIHQFYAPLAFRVRCPYASTDPLEIPAQGDLIWSTSTAAWPTPSWTQLGIDSVSLVGPDTDAPEVVALGSTLDGSNTVPQPNSYHKRGGFGVAVVIDTGQGFTNETEFIDRETDFVSPQDTGEIEWTLGSAGLYEVSHSLERPLVDAVGLLDTADQEFTASREITDVIGLVDDADYEHESGSVDLDATDPIGILDDVATVRSVSRENDDVVGLVDSVAVELSAQSDVTDLIGILDSTETTLEATITDVVGVTDSADRSATHEQAVDDEVGILDSAVGAQTIAREVDDDLELIDDVVPDGTLQVILLDQIGLLDSASGAQDIQRDHTDAIGLLDSHSKQSDLTVDDEVNLADDASPTRDIFVDLTNPLGVLDSVLTFSEIERIASDGVGIDDDALVALALSVEQVDLLGIVDAVETARDIQTLVTDLLGLLDSSAHVLSRELEVVDGIGILDSMAVFAGAAFEIIDQLGITDSAVAGFLIDQAIDDALQIIDSTTFEKYLTDVINIIISLLLRERFISGGVQERTISASIEKSSPVVDTQETEIVAENDERGIQAAAGDALVKKVPV